MRPAQVSTRVRAVIVGAALFSASLTTANAVEIGGVEFPQGQSSFADAVKRFAPAVVSGKPTVAHLGAVNAVGLPNGLSATCTKAETCGYVSLGSGGSITLEFIGNRLTGSGDTRLDLWVFEVGAQVEDTFVEISKNGTRFFSVGKVLGSTAGIDIDSFGFGRTDEFRFVRLTDDPDEGDQPPGGASIGADIDAVGAISSVPAVGGSVTGVKPSTVTCRNTTTGKSVTINGQARSYDCQAAGLIVRTGDSVVLTIKGKAD